MLLRCFWDASELLKKMLKIHGTGLTSKFEIEIILDTTQMVWRCFEMLLWCYGDARTDAKWLQVPRLVLKSTLELS